LSYAHIFITYFLISHKERNTKTKQKGKRKKHKKQSNKEKQRNTKKQKEKQRNTKNKAKRKTSVILSLANCTLNSPGIS
jgi:hypothetical protein